MNASCLYQCYNYVSKCSVIKQKSCKVFLLFLFLTMMAVTSFILYTAVKFRMCPYRVAPHFKNGTKQGSVQNSVARSSLQSKMGKGRTKRWAFYPTLQESRLAQMGLQLQWIPHSRALSMECILSLLILPTELKAKSSFHWKERGIARKSCRDADQKLELNPKLT